MQVCCRQTLHEQLARNPVMKNPLLVFLGEMMQTPSKAKYLAINEHWSKIPPQA